MDGHVDHPSQGLGQAQTYRDCGIIRPKLRFEIDEIIDGDNRAGAG